MPTLPPHPALVSLWCPHSLPSSWIYLVLCAPGTLWPWSSFSFLKCISLAIDHSWAFFPSPCRDNFLRGFLPTTPPCTRMINISFVLDALFLKPPEPTQKCLAHDNMCSANICWMNFNQYYQIKKGQILAKTHGILLNDEATSRMAIVMTRKIYSIWKLYQMSDVDTHMWDTGQETFHQREATMSASGLVVSYSGNSEQGQHPRKSWHLLNNCVANCFAKCLRYHLYSLSSQLYEVVSIYTAVWQSSL